MTVNKVYCCGYNQEARVYYLPAVNCIWKRYYFLDECFVCGQTIGVLQIKTKSGEIKNLHRFKGEKAFKYRDKIIKENQVFKVGSGSLQNERTFYNNSGIIYNFNNRKVGKNEDFCLIGAK